jgi:hypothetical protein
VPCGCALGSIAPPGERGRFDHVRGAKSRRWSHPVARRGILLVVHAGGFGSLMGHELRIASHQLKSSDIQTCAPMLVRRARKTSSRYEST